VSSARNFISDYIAGELPGEIREPFERHLARCPNCIGLRRVVPTTIELSRRAFGSDSGDSSLQMPEELVTAMLAARAAGPRSEEP
jgi:hypothetical protein